MRGLAATRLRLSGPRTPRRMTSRLAFALVGMATALAVGSPTLRAADEGSLYVTAGTVHTGAGETFRPGAVSIVDGRIVAVGSPDSVAPPAGAQRIEAGPGAVVIPGLVAAWTQHVSADGTDPASLAPDVRAVDGYDFTVDEAPLLAGGVTTVVVSPGVTQVVPGRAAVVKTAGASRKTRLLLAEAGLAVGIGDGVQKPLPLMDPPDAPDAALNPILPHRSQLPVTRAGSILLLRELLGSASDGYVADVAAGRVPLFVAASSAGDIEAALAFAGETGVKATLVGALEAGTMRSEIAAAGVPVVLAWPGRPGRVTASTSAEVEAVRARARSNAAVLARAGVPFALTVASDADLPHLLFVVASAAREGLDATAALASVTSSAARIAGVADRVGELAAGRDGDLVILTGEPTDLRAVPITTVVDGRVVWEHKRGTTTVIVRAAEVHVGDGTVLSPGEVAFEGDRIVEVGHTVGVPPGARVIDLGRGAVMPGMIDAYSHAGLAGPGGSVATDLTTAMSASKAVDPKDASFALLSAEGITTILAVPGGNGRVNGRASVVKTAGEWPGRRVVLVDAGMVMRLTGERDLKSAKGQLTSALKKARGYRSAFEKYEKDKKAYDEWKKKHDAEVAKKAAEDKKKAEVAKKAAEAKKKAEADKKDDEKKDGEKSVGAPDEEKKDGKDEAKKPAVKSEKKAEKKPAKKEADKEEPRKPKIDEAMEGWAAVLDGKAPILVRARTVEEIRAALDTLGKEKIGKDAIRIIVVGADDARRMRSALTKASAGVIASPSVLVRDRDGDVNLLRDLSLSRLSSAVGSDSYLGGHELHDLLAFAVRTGLSPSAAVKLVTGDAAALLGVADRVGTLAPGKDADIVLLSAPPFAPGSNVVSVYVSGEEVRRDPR